MKKGYLITAAIVAVGLVVSLASSSKSKPKIKKFVGLDDKFTNTHNLTSAQMNNVKHVHATISDILKKPIAKGHEVNATNACKSILEGTYEYDHEKSTILVNWGAAGKLRYII
jgi:hypothetical protein